MAIQALWGGLGRAALKLARTLVNPIKELLHLGEVGGIELEPTKLYQELSRLDREDRAAPRIAVLGRDDYIPAALHTEADIPWKRPYAYEVEMYGRDVKTGRFTHVSRAMPYSHELTIGEIEDDMDRLFGGEGEYPQVAIERMSVVAAFTRSGEMR